MRNGLNITGVSESVHEYRDNPEEAVADFRVVTPLPAPGEETAVSRTLALRDGTYRIARDFTLRHRLALDSRSGDPTPWESMLVAVAACVLTTKVNGFTSRGVTLGALRTTARARLRLGPDGAPAAGAVLDDLGWSTEIDCDAPSETLRSINELVAVFSPNHQAALDTTSAEATVTVLGPTGSEVFPVVWAPAVQESPDDCAVEADVVWEYGSESAYTTRVTTGGIRRVTGPLVVDQAKQMLGIDKGPNSQEILLSAVTAEVAGLLRHEPALRDAPVEGARLLGSGRLDTRGMLNVVREVPSRFHDLRLDLAVECDPGHGHKLAAALGAALSRAVLPATLLAQLTVAVEMVRGGRQEAGGLTTLAQTEAVRDEVTRRQQAAQQG
ncbi:hypothetical protein [Streptomyces apocyni]|uniref:hypothetical protein n=1 Tax=Streptomyces apocyni TaxID=2654677 RepID=UPI0012EA1DF6|nr:hypothetical protein [Streptomyces apocyni]